MTSPPQGDGVTIGDLNVNYSKESQKEHISEKKIDFKLIDGKITVFYWLLSWKA